MKPSESPPATTEDAGVPLRVRFVPLWGWLFVGTVVFAQTFLATRLWGGWNARALLQLFAFQIFFLPRIFLLATGISMALALVLDRLVRWIARPMAQRWLRPIKLIPPETEIPLYLRPSERQLLHMAARRKADHLWEPGWLVLTDDRLLWLSGVWRTIAWEIDARDADHPIANRVRRGESPRWFGGLVVGVPPRVLIERDAEDKNGQVTETLAMIDPAGLEAFLRPGSNHGEESMETLLAIDAEKSVRTSAAAPAENPIEPAAWKVTPCEARPNLPPRRDYGRTCRVLKSGQAPAERNPGAEVSAKADFVNLPPRRDFR